MQYYFFCVQSKSKKKSCLYPYKQPNYDCYGYRQRLIKVINCRLSNLLIAPQYAPFGLYHQHLVRRYKYHVDS